MNTLFSEYIKGGRQRNVPAITIKTPETAATAMEKQLSARKNTTRSCDSFNKQKRRTGPPGQASTAPATQAVTTTGDSRGWCKKKTKQNRKAKEKRKNKAKQKTKNKGIRDRRE